MQIMRAHGLYCAALAGEGAIGLTDNQGNVYCVVIVTSDGLVVDADTTMDLYVWLGY